MAMVVPEAAGAVTEGTAAVRGARRAGRHRGGPSPAEQDARAGQSAQRRRKAGRTAQRHLNSTGYQHAILTEFVVAVVIIGLAPLVKPSDTAQAKAAPSPYSVGDMLQLLGAGATYFVLALFAGSQRWGRVAAWFGGLVLLGIMYVEFSSGRLGAVFSTLGAAANQKAANQAAQEAITTITGAAGATFAPVPDATGNFPVINPSTTQSGGLLPTLTQGPPPGVAASTDPNVTQTTISPPPGGNGVITT